MADSIDNSENGLTGTNASGAGVYNANGALNIGTLNPDTLAALSSAGWAGGNPIGVPGNVSSNNTGGQDGAPVTNGFSPEFQTWMQSNGYSPSLVDGMGGQNLGIYGANGQQVGSNTFIQQQDDSGAILAMMGGIAGFGAGAMLGGGGGAASGGGSSGADTFDVGAADGANAADGGQMIGNAAGGGADAGSASFLPQTGADATGGIGTLSPDMAQSLGVPQAVPDYSAYAGANAGMSAPLAGDATGTGILDTGASPAAGDWFAGANGTGLSASDAGLGTDASLNAADGAAGAADASAGGGFTDSLGKMGGSAMNWIESHPAQAAMLGISGIQSLSTPKLPGAANTALNASGAAVQQAQGILSSGGTSSPSWAGTKASIDSSINEQLKNATESLIQNAQNSGQGGTNSAVVQQRINQLRQQAEQQKQQQYSAALQQIVSSAVSELTGGNQTLNSVANMQLSQSQEARQAAAQTAQLALLLGKAGNGPGTAATTGGG